MKRFLVSGTFVGLLIFYGCTSLSPSAEKTEPAQPKPVPEPAMTDHPVSITEMPPSPAVFDPTLDLIPNHARWQYYPPEVKRVTVDPEGRPWFEMYFPFKKRPSMGSLRWSVEQARSKTWPWVTGARIVLHDAAGRTWIMSNGETHHPHIYLPDEGVWTWRYNKEHMDETIFETSDGRIYISNDGIVSLYHRKVWPDFDLYGRTEQERDLKKDTRRFAAPCYVEGPDGTVYIWSTSKNGSLTPTRGYFVQKGKIFKQRSVTGDERLNHLSAVVPLADGRVLVCPVKSAAFVDWDPDKLKMLKAELQVKIQQLGDDDFERREAAEDFLRRYIFEAADLLRSSHESAEDPEVRSRLHRVMRQLPSPDKDGVPYVVDGRILKNVEIRCQDPAGNIWVYASTENPVSGENTPMAVWQITPAGKLIPTPFDWYPSGVLPDPESGLYVGRSGKGIWHWNGEKLTEITDNRSRDFSEIMALDRYGRLFISNGSGKVCSVNPEMPEKRKGLEMDIWTEATALIMDSDGRPWAKFTDRPYALLSEYREGEWVDWPLPEGAGQTDRFLMTTAMRERRFMFVSRSGGVFYFSEALWKKYSDLTEWVEAAYEDILSHFDNRWAGSNFHARLALDSKGRMWVAQKKSLTMYTGKRWIDMLPAVEKDAGKLNTIRLCRAFGDKGELLLSDGNKMLVIDRGSFRTNVREIPPVEKMLFEAFETTVLDSKGRLWLPMTSEACRLLDLEKDVLFREVGFPVREDAKGNMWCIYPEKGIFVLNPDTGESAYISVGPVALGDQLVFTSPSDAWLLTTEGWMHLQFDYAPDADFPTVLNIQNYNLGLPRDGLVRMFNSPPGMIWATRFASETSEIFRVTLPVPSNPE